MWIMSQNKRVMVNSKKLIDIYVSKNGKEIEARYGEEMYQVVSLATYDNLDTSLKAMKELSIAFSLGDKDFTFPLGGQIK